jgi:radical SAM superfamily enzyme YgiQ (UPF0313 family)
MNIKLIAPRSTVRPMDSAWKTRMSPPLSLLVLAALTPREHTVALADENIERPSFRDSPDLVGITVKVDTFDRACEIARAYRRRGVPVVMGGIHPTVCPEDCAPHAEAVVVGEAEELWLQLLRDFARGPLRRVYRDERPVDPALIPIPRWDALKARRYLFTNTITIGRGCPWRCDFCYNSSDNIPAGYRMKPIPNIVAEIRTLDAPHVMFIDDNFIGDVAGAWRLVKELRRMKVSWHAAVSAEIGRHEDLLDLMADSGCKSLFIGFESVNQSSLLNCHKVQNRVTDYDVTLARIHSRGIMVNASLVFGFDQDDPSVFQGTLAWLTRNKVATMTAHILTPYPGTRLHQRLVQERRIIDHDLRHYNTAHVVFRPQRMSPQELAEGYRWMYRQFYSWKSILARWPACADQRIAYLEFALLYRKFGKLTCFLGRSLGMRPLAKLAKRIAYPGWTAAPASHAAGAVMPAIAGADGGRSYVY